jgi:hypothetical protein
MMDAGVDLLLTTTSQVALSTAAQVFDIVAAVPCDHFSVRCVARCSVDSFGWYVLSLSTPAPQGSITR